MFFAQKFNIKLLQRCFFFKFRLPRRYFQETCQEQSKPKQYFWNNFFKCHMSRLSKAVHKNSQNVLLFTQCNFVPSLHCIWYCGIVFYICFLLKQNWSQNRWTFSKYNSKTESKSKHILRIWHKIYFATLRIGDDPSFILYFICAWRCEIETVCSSHRPRASYYERRSSDS